jgi:hypothetical protein
VAVLAAVTVAGCVTPPPPIPRAAPGITRFSGATPGGPLPHCWRAWDVARLKRPTDYQLVSMDGTTVIRAQAESSVSGIACPVQIDLRQYPVIRWRWKVPQLIAGADNTDRATEDSPARIVLSFEGDTRTLPFDDRIFFNRVRSLSGIVMPYATLMYIWENRQPPGTVIRNQNTSRVRMIVVESGEAGTGQWRDVVRNAYDDYRLAFGEEPPRLMSIGLMTDSDNTGTTTEAFFGDIEFLAPPGARG